MAELDHELLDVCDVRCGAPSDHGAHEGEGPREAFVWRQHGAPVPATDVDEEPRLGASSWHEPGANTPELRNGLRLSFHPGASVDAHGTS